MYFMLTNTCTHKNASLNMDTYQSNNTTCTHIYVHVHVSIEHKAIHIQNVHVPACFVSPVKGPFSVSHVPLEQTKGQRFADQPVLPTRPLVIPVLHDFPAPSSTKPAKRQSEQLHIESTCTL